MTFQPKIEAETSTAIPDDALSDIDIFLMAEIPDEAMDQEPEDTQFLDGLLLPFGHATLIAMDGGGGKSTSVNVSSLESAVTGNFFGFGGRRHDRPLNVLIICGEEGEDELRLRLKHQLPAGRDGYLEARKAGRVSVCSWEDYMDRLRDTMRKKSKRQDFEPLFGTDGKFTKIGKRFLKGAFERCRWDVVVYDTLGSLSDAEYTDEKAARATARVLRKLARKTRAAHIVLYHTTKAPSLKPNDKVSNKDGIAMIRGSGMLVNSFRHALAMFQDPQQEKAGIGLAEGDEFWIACVKSNIPGYPHAGKVLSLIKSREKLTFLARIPGSNLLIEDAARANEIEIRRQIVSTVLNLTALAAHMRQPFGDGAGRMSIAGMQKDLLKRFFPEGTTPSMISATIQELLDRAEDFGDERIVPVRVGSSTSAKPPMVHDVPGGYYAHAKVRKDEKPFFAPGVFDVERLARLMEDAKVSGYKATIDADLAETERLKREEEAREADIRAAEEALAEEDEAEEAF